MNGYMNWDKINRQKKVASKVGTIVNQVASKSDKQLKYNTIGRDFNQKLFDKGVEFFNVGGTSEKIPEKLLNDFSFMSGYKHAERLAMIDKLKNGRSK